MKGVFTKGLASGLVALVAASFITVGTANAYPTLGVCQYDAVTNINSCSYSNPDGIKSVFISLATDDGIVVVVNETYDCASPVFVAWENLGPAHHYEVEACPPDPATPDPDPLPVGTLLEPPESPVIVDDFRQPAAPGRTPRQALQELLLLTTPRIMK